MIFTLDDLDFLASDQGTRLLERLAHEAISDTYKTHLLYSLRRELPDSRAEVVVEMALLRKKAVAKFGDDAAKMFFTRTALEQACHPLIRKYQAEHIVLLGGINHIVDVCCGIGANSLTFAQKVAPVHGEVLGLDNDPVHIRMAQMNAAALRLTNVRFEVADIREYEIPLGSFIFFNPNHITETGGLLSNPEDYEPPLSLVHQWGDRRALVRLSSNVDVELLRKYKGIVEFVSINGNLEEALWRIYKSFDQFYTDAVALRGSINFPIATSFGARWTTEVDISEPRVWLCEPDPAIVRAGYVKHIARISQGYLLDADEFYFTADKPPKYERLWVSTRRIVDWMPFNLKKLVSYLRAEGVGHVMIKKRGVPMTPDELLPKMKLEGDESRTLVLTRYKGDSIVLICEDYQPS